MSDESRPLEKNNQESDWDALARHVAGEGEPADAQAMDTWVASNPLDAAFVRAVKDHGDRAERSVAMPVNVEAAWDRVRARMTDGEGASTSAGAVPALTVVRGAATRPVISVERQIAARKKLNSSGGTPWGRITMAVAAGLIAIVGVRQWIGTDDPATIASSARVVATQVGVRDSITLSDGTRVLLAPGSRLTVATGFDAGDRTVTLDGAAFFDVTHDEAHPFTVRAAGAEIRDIGTAFTVKTDAAGGVAVAVTHGIVSVRDPARADAVAVELHAGDRGLLRDGEVAVARGTVTDDDLGWTRGQLSYRDAPLSEVQADLERWYGLTLHVADSVLLRLTVTMPAQPDSARVIRTIAALLGADAEQRGDTVILRSARNGTIP